MSAAADAQPQATAPDAQPQATPARTRLKPSLVRAPQVARALVRSGASSYEVEVQSPTGFSRRAFDPVLRVGDKEFSKYRESPSVGEYGAVFAVAKADFDALSDASAVSVAYGRTRVTPLSLGRLDKRSLAIR